MRFSTLIVRNLLRRRTRTLLTVLGLAVGIAAVVTLSAVAWGFEQSFHDIYEAKGIDLILVRAGVADRLSSSLDATLVDRIQAVPGVSEVARSLIDAVAFEEAGVVSALVSGWEPGSILFRGIRPIEGRAIEATDGRAAMLGRVLALSLGKTTGDTVEVAGEPFEVVGVYESTSLFESGGLIVPLKELQRMMGREGQVTGFVLTANADVPEGRSSSALGKALEAALPGIAAVPARDYVEQDVILRLAKSMAWATSLVALILGSVGMLNTMVMSVFERTTEIGVLRALGWRRSRVLKLVLGEALVLGVVGALLGGLLGYVGLHALTLAPTARGFINPVIPPATYAFGLALAVGLSLLGGLYPAWHASQLEPTEALRHD